MIMSVLMTVLLLLGIRHIFWKLKQITANILYYTWLRQTEVLLLFFFCSSEGDFRMVIGEDKSKVANIVKDNIQHFRILYSNILRDCPQVVYKPHQGKLEVWYCKQAPEEYTLSFSISDIWATQLSSVKSVYFLNAATTPCFSNETLNTWEMTLSDYEKKSQEMCMSLYVWYLLQSSVTRWGVLQCKHEPTYKENKKKKHDTWQHARCRLCCFCWHVFSEVTVILCNHQH